ncbi:serine/threonine protein kinase [Pyxidicoccus parkwayensis]|uniref:Serine/threonine protein kinase n=1 Tax=Pyxidicoccus parkwayensis TaxID=2813578 RepID=A0ABX7NL66_9BACT|nr:serine/threonine-protein kinase [Pyxidicoccus parkwaysis]QSQ19153.1 serine/threonine protein kinase [Pyxidicoccus parkwaysis]
MERSPSPPRSTPIAPQLLQEHLRRGAASREVTLARFISRVATACVFSTLCFGPLLGWPHTTAIIAVIAGYALYYAWVHRRLQKTEPTAALPWFHVALESSLVGILFLVDLFFAGPEMALGAPNYIIAAAAIVASALRSDARLPLFAAVVTAVELVLLYVLLAYPRLPTPIPLMLSPPMLVLRALYIVVVGWLARLIAGQFRGMAEEALRAIRQQELLGRYFLHERLGAGGMAEVFRATYSPEGGIEKTVAVKRILPAYAEDEQFIALFRREAELGAILQHPNIVQVLDVGRLDDTHFIAMEYVDGLSLRQLIKEHGPLPVAAVTYLGAELAAALDYLHRRTSREGVPLNLVHRDINPPNVLLSRIGDVKLSDFGIARAVTHSPVTHLGQVRGKADYMAPEQLLGGVLDGRADLFALGLTMHEALTGRRILHGMEHETRAALMDAVKGLPPPSALRREVPPEVDAIIMALLQAQPRERPQRGNHVDDLLRALPAPVAPYPYGQSKLAQAIRDVLARRAGDTTTPVTRPVPVEAHEEDGRGLDATTRIRPGR